LATDTISSEQSLLSGQSSSRKGYAEFDSTVCETIGEMHPALNFDIANWRPSALKTNVESSQMIFFSHLDERNIIISPIIYYRIGL
jgi:hypothetical protein